MNDSTLTDRQRFYSLCGICTSVFAWGISFAGLIPLMSLTLEGRGYDPLMIGLLGAITPVGVILAAPMAPGFIQALGTARAIFITSVGITITVALLPVFDSYESWLGLRLLAGLFGAVPWIGTETWVNAIATEKSRGRITAIYITIMAISFAIGPLMLSILGTQGNQPYIIYTGLMALSHIPLILIWRYAPVLHHVKGLKFSSFIWTIPSILAAAMVCGMVDMSFFSFLPIWGLRMGFAEDTAVLLLSIFVIGNVVLQLPIGWLADKTDRYMVLIGCGIIGIISPVLIILVAESTWSISIILFFWGGCVWALYSVSLAILGERYKGGTLTAASAVFIVAYEIANIVGPPLAGVSIDLWGPDGLMVFMGGSMTVFVIVTTIRQIIKHRQAQTG
ncbi:MAG: MFS transporter [Rhodospirillales bacterium]|jgi:MFS family permease|nr:MFS transporter [Rhodospirillales bacterium]